MNRRATSAQILDEGLDAALVLKDIAFFLPLVDELDAHARVEKGKLAQSLRKRLVNELDIREDRCARLEANGRAALVCLASHRQGCDRVAEAIFLLVDLAVPADGQDEVFRQRIYDGHAYPVQAARYLVRAVIKLPAGVQDGHDDLRGRFPSSGWIFQGSRAHCRRP